MFKTIGDTIKIIKNGLKDAIILDLLYKVSVLCFIYPIFMFVLEAFLKSCGLTYVNLYNVVKLLKNPIVILVIIAMLLIMSFCIIVKIISLMLTFDYNNQKGKLFNIIKINLKEKDTDEEQRISIFRIIFIALKKSICLCKIKDIRFLIIFIVMIPLSTSHVMNKMVEKFSLADLSAEYFYNKQLLATIVFILIVFLLIYARKKIFILFIHIITKEKYNNNKSIYKNMILKNKVKNIIEVCIINIILIIILIPLYIIGVAVTAFFVKLIIVSKLELVVFLEILEIFDDAYQYVALVIFIMVNVAHIYVLVYNYFSLEENININKNIEDSIYVDKKNKVVVKSYITKRKKYSVIFIVCICFAITAMYLSDEYTNGQLYIEKSLEQMKVTSHRGYSKESPENTIPAIQKAIENKADFVEIDVQLTKNGEIVVFHDSNIKRITGIDKKISDITYEELSKLDAGKWFSDEYINVKVPTLREVLEYSKGKIELNIELKNAPEDGSLSEGVAKLIEEYNFERQCVVTSFDYSELNKIKEFNKKIKTGYIMRYIYNDCFSDKNIDVLSIKRTYVNANILKKAHKNGKEVYVWTVNNYDEMVALNKIGVDNIITDDPVKGKRAVYTIGEKKILKLIFDYEKYFNKNTIF